MECEGRSDSGQTMDNELTIETTLHRPARVITALKVMPAAA